MSFKTWWKTMFPKIPRKKDFKRLGRGYKLGVYDCSNMAGRYARILKNEGYNPVIVNIEDHSIIRCDDVNNMEMYYDVSRRCVRPDLEFWGDPRTAVTLSYEEMLKYDSYK